MHPFFYFLLISWLALFQKVDRINTSKIIVSKVQESSNIKDDTNDNESEEEEEED